MAKSALIVDGWLGDDDAPGELLLLLDDEVPGGYEDTLAGALKAAAEHFGVPPADAGEAERLREERDHYQRLASSLRTDYECCRDLRKADFDAATALVADRDATIKSLREDIGHLDSDRASLRADIAARDKVLDHMRDQSVCGWLKHALDALKALADAPADPPAEEPAAKVPTCAVAGCSTVLDGDLGYCVFATCGGKLCGKHCRELRGLNAAVAAAGKPAASPDSP